MQGYILNITKVKDEDLIVTILTNSSLITTYRFYGARHSNINIGYKIDFELESSLKSKFPRLADVINLGFSWMVDFKKMLLWQNFIKELYKHLKDTQEVESFYFDMLDELVRRIKVQDFKRAVVEVYVKLLEFEGRLHKEFECLLCETKILNSSSLVRGFIPTHPNCSYSLGIEQTKLRQLFDDKISLTLNDKEIVFLYNLILEGI